MFRSILEIVAALVGWLRGRTVETRVDRLEDAAAKKRAQEMRDFDAQAADVRDAADAVELLKSATKAAKPD
jgi:hypothetical protein